MTNYRTKKFLIDCDGVLANFQKPILANASKISGKEWTTEDIINYSMEEVLGKFSEEAFSIALTQGFCRSLEPYPGSVDFIHRLQGLGEVHVVTTAYSRSPFWHYERLEWLRDHYEIPERSVHFTSRKEFFQGDYLVEDKASTLLEWSLANPRGKAFLVDHPYNRSFRDIISSQDEKTLRIKTNNRYRVKKLETILSMLGD